MPFDWWEFFNLAEALSKSPANEAGARTAISRYYYACHNIARPKFHLDHTELWNAYKDHADAQHQSVGIKGDRLRQARIWADYNSTANPLELTSARIIAASLRQLLQSL